MKVTKKSKITAASDKLVRDLTTKLTKYFNNDWKRMVNQYADNYVRYKKDGDTELARDVKKKLDAIIQNLVPQTAFDELTDLLKGRYEVKSSAVTASNVRPLAHEYASRKQHYNKNKSEYEGLREDKNNDVLSRESKMWIAKGQLDDVRESLVAELVSEFDEIYTDLEDRSAVYDEMYGKLRSINKEDALGLTGAEMDFIVQDAMKRIDFRIDSTTHVNSSRDWYFGKEEADQFGDLIVKKLAGKTVSKRRDKAEEPGGLIFEADRLGIDMWDLLRALEGMCYDGRVREIDDSTYKIFESVEGQQDIVCSEDEDEDEIVEQYLQDACKALGCTTKEWNYKNYLGETETHVLLVDRKGKTIGMLDLHYPEDIMKIYEENDHDYDAISEKVMQYLKDEINMFSEAYDDNVITL